MTTVVAVMRRSYSPAMFDDLDLPPHTRTWDRATGVTTLTFDDLNDEQAHQVWARMESTDDADQAERAKLRTAAAAGATNLAAMHLAYTLGDPVPDAVLPQE